MTTDTNIDLNETQLVKYYENLISFIRSRLNVIGTSVYLLQSDLPATDVQSYKYFRKINEEIDSIRKLINE